MTIVDESTYSTMIVAKLWRKCYEGILVRSLLMKAYGFTNKSTWSISQGSVSNVCTEKDLGGIICILTYYWFCSSLYSIPYSTKF